MSDRIKNAFDGIRADESLRESTMEYVGRELARRKKKRPAPRFRMAFAALAAALVVMIGGGYSAYAMPASYVSIDVNPSVELTLNRFDRVLKATAYNADGELVLEGLDLKNQLCADAIDNLVDCEAFQAYMAQGNDLSIAVVSNNDDLLTGILNCRAVARYGAYYTTADAETLQAAHEYGMSFGKYEACLALRQYDDSITPEQCSGMTMREIHTLIAQYGGGSETGSGSGSQSCTGSCFNYLPGTGGGSGTQSGNGGSGYHGGN